MIDNIPFEYEEKDITYENAQTIDKSIAKSNLLDFKNVIDEYGIICLLMHGTLLGAIREHNFISHDIDIDLCTFDETSLIKIIPILAEKKLLLCRHTSGHTYSFMRDGVYIDVYIVKKANMFWRWRYYDYCYHLFPKHYLKSIEKISFLDKEFYIPQNPIKLLEFWYGKNWKTPIKDFPSRDRTHFVRVIRTILFPLLPLVHIIKKHL